MKSTLRSTALWESTSVIPRDIKSPSESQTTSGRVTNHSGLPRTLRVSTLKVLHPEKPLSPGQTWTVGCLTFKSPLQWERAEVKRSQPLLSNPGPISYLLQRPTLSTRGGVTLVHTMGQFRGKNQMLPGKPKVRAPHVADPQQGRGRGGCWGLGSLRDRVWVWVWVWRQGWVLSVLATSGEAMIQT